MHRDDHISGLDELARAHDDMSQETLLRKLEKLSKINSALIERVERSMDQQANAFSLFQTAISLETEVRLRTEELKCTLERLEHSNSELVTARDAAERANRFKTRFFTAVGHDLLQPLHAAKLSLSAISESGGDNEQSHLISRVDHALVSIEDILKTILDLSKLEDGFMKPAIQDVVLDDVFRPLINELEPIARAKGLLLTYRPNASVVRSDPLMLRRILQNLLANAVRYTESGRIFLGARHRGREMRIEVWDTGPGIRTDERDQIFEEFQRGAASEAADISGFGLGLSIAQRMTDALGHTLDLCTRSDKGTCFQVYARYVGDRMPGAKAQSFEVSRRAYGFKNAKILVVDNDDAVLDAMKTVMENWSCDCRFVRSGAGVEQLLNSEPNFKVQVVLADYHLDRGETGLDVISCLRRHLSHDFKAVVVTADHTDNVHKAIEDLGCQLLLKPVRPAELRALLQHLIG